MRISCDTLDPGYLEWNKIGRLAARVYLDGVEMRDVITADEEAGMVIRYRRNTKGLFVVAAGIVSRETLYGVVELH